MSDPTTIRPFPSHPAKRLTLFFAVSDHVHHRSLMVELLKHARHAKLAGATVFQGVIGYGHSGELHHQHLLTTDSPESVVIVDLPDRIDGFIAEISDLVKDVLVVVEDVEVIEV